MMRSLFAAVSGLRNHQLSLSVIGNNISNINTVGFKTGRALFQEMLSQTVRGATAPTTETGGTNPLQIGLGMSVASVANSFEQGQLQTTGNMLDMAIQGEGFFVSRGGDRMYYSRAGAFTFDALGRLTTTAGQLVQGWLANPEGIITSGSALGDISLPFGQKSPAQATTTVRLASNLDSGAEALGTILEANSLRAMAQSSASLQQLFDSSGRALGIETGEIIEISYAGTASTELANLSDAEGNALDLQVGDVITVNDGVNTNTFNYTAGMTLGAFAAQVQAALQVTEPDVTVSVNSDGSLLIANPAGGGGNDLSVTISAPGRSIFNRLVVSLPVIDGTNTARTETTQVQVQLVNGTHFTNLSELATDLESALNLGSAGASVVFQNGRFQYDNSVGSDNLVDIRLTHSGTGGVFGQAMGLEGQDIAVGDTAQSDLLLTMAVETDNLVNLYTNQGEHLGLTVGDTMTLNAFVGGADIPQVTLTVVNTGDGSAEDRQVQTLGGLLEEMEAALDLTTAGSVELVDGEIVINGRSGLANEITGLRLSETDNAALAAAMYFDEIQAATDVTHEASIRVFDSQGNDFLLSMIFTKDNDSPNRWNWRANLEEGTILAGGTGSVTFNGDGTLASFTTDDGLPLRIDPASGADSPIEIEFDAGTRGGLDGITGFSQPSTTAIVDQDGYTMGSLQSISVDSSGVIRGVFTNGVSRPLAQVALATFNNPAGLQREGGNGWIVTGNSGEAVVRSPGINSGVGTISAGTLEMSNVDIAREFTNMIIAQRGFQANARTITTSDEMLMELVNLKR